MNYEYTKRLDLIEDALSRALPRTLPQDVPISWLSAVFPGVGQISEAALKSAFLPAKDLISRGGKRWRPLLMTLVCESLGGGDAAVPLSPLVEFCHNASLIHDDIEDAAEERRGAPAIHRIYGQDAAINSGSLLYFLPLSFAEEWAAALSNGVSVGSAAWALCKIWAAKMRKLHLGQAMDISWHKDHSFVPSVEEYYLMCRLKTGSLAALAAALGVYAAFAGKDEAESGSVTAQFEEASEKLGAGFQILDDVKNLTTGNPGKKRGDDVVEGKKSLPVILYLNRYPHKMNFVSRCFSAAGEKGAGAPEVEEFIGEICASGVLDEAGETGLGFIARAREIFKGRLGCPLTKKAGSIELLAGLTEFIS